MSAAEEHRRDPQRLAAVMGTGLLDSDVEETFDRLTRLAVRLTGVPAAFISLVDADRDFYKSACGFGEPLASARELQGPTFCHFTIQSAEPLAIPDTAADPRYRDVPTVKSLGVAAYVGVPLIVDGQAIGAFCAIDTSPRPWTDEDIATLRDLAGIALNEIQSGVARRLLEASTTSAEQGRRRLADLFRQAPAFIAVIRGSDRVFEVANDEFCRLIGGHDVVGRTLDDVLPEAAAQDFLSLIDRVLTTGAPFIGNEMAVALRRPETGALEERFLNFVYQPMIGAGDAPSSVFIHGIDVTEQVRARRAVDVLNLQLQTQAAALELQTEELQATTEELQASTEELHERTEAAERAQEVTERAMGELATAEARYRLLTQAVPVQVWTARPDGLLDFVSDQAASYFRASLEDTLGAGWTAFVHPDDLAAAAARWTESLASFEPYQAEFRLRNAAGEYRWHLARALPHRDAAGEVVGWIGTNTDVERERSARADAEAANRSKSEFLTVMSHELRTPLNAIGGYAELLAMGVRGPISEPQRHDIERIQRSQRHLLGLINGILNYAKVDAGAVAYATERVPIDEVLATCESLTAPQARDKGLTLDIPVDVAMAAAADREKVQQVLLNLLSNAIKFTGPGGEVRVEARATDDQIVLRVIDTGRGISANEIERVFEPFVQVDARLTREHAGTGLGLAISRELARGMGGDLIAESELGRGSAFQVSLPRFDRAA